MKFFYKISPLAVMQKPISRIRNHICASPTDLLQEKLRTTFRELRDIH